MDALYHRVGFDIEGLLAVVWLPLLLAVVWLPLLLAVVWLPLEDKPVTTVPQQEMKPLNRRAIAMKNDYGPVLYLDVVLALNFSCLNLPIS